MNLVYDDSTESWEDWDVQLGTIPAPRDPRKSNYWYIKDAYRLYVEFVFLGASNSHIYNFQNASEYILDTGRTRRFYVRKRKDKYIDWYESENGAHVSYVEFRYTEVFNWFIDVLALLEEMDDLVEDAGNEMLDVERTGDRDGGVRKLFEMWEDVRTIVNTYKTRKWHSSFQSLAF